jgi:putative NADH-flavin reductase
MNATPPDPSSLVIVGATGMVGGYTLRYALDHPAVGAVTAIGRRRLGVAHPKLKEVLHEDFADCSALAGALSGQDPAFRVLFPNQVIRGDDLARVMVEVVVRRTGESRSLVFENRDIRAMVETA